MWVSWFIVSILHLSAATLSAHYPSLSPAAAANALSGLQSVEYKHKSNTRVCRLLIGAIQSQLLTGHEQTLIEFLAHTKNGCQQIGSFFMQKIENWQSYLGWDDISEIFPKL